MPTKRTAASIPSLAADGSIQWQSYTYGELLSALQKDLQLDASTDLAPGTLESRLAADLIWRPLPYNATNWTDNGSVQVGQYGLDALGFVHVRGVAKSVAGYTFSTPSTLVIATLPVGFRPGAQEIFDCFQVDTANQPSVNRLDVATDGRLLLNGGNSTSESVFIGGNNGIASFLTLKHIMFQQVK